MSCMLKCDNQEYWLKTNKPTKKTHLTPQNPKQRKKKKASQEERRKQTKTYQYNRETYITKQPNQETPNG